jgi:hypothetical protein
LHNIFLPNDSLRASLLPDCFGGQFGEHQYKMMERHMLNKVTGLARALAILLAVVAGFVAVPTNVALVLVILGVIAGIGYGAEDLSKLALPPLFCPLWARLWVTFQPLAPNWVPCLAMWLWQLPGPWPRSSPCAFMARWSAI